MSEKTIKVANHKCRVIINCTTGTPIIFLHGLSYTAEVWQRISVLELLKEKHVPFMALDMPYGIKSECQPHTRSVETNVALVHEALLTYFPSTTPVMAGASIGSHMALQYASRYPVKGLLLVGAVRVLDESLLPAYSRFMFPVRLIIGSEDNIASEEELRTLASKLSNAKLTVYEGEGHSAYMHSAERFKKDLLELYVMAE